jgi:hypothetical protein
MAKRLWSYRSGDLKEDLGLVLLSGIGAVAPVSRKEDVGLDAIVTLFRPEARLLFAQESFYVQIKSSKTTEIAFDEDDVEWLRLIAMPFFIGLVEGENSVVRLYSTNCLYEFFKVDEQYKSILVRFGEGDTEDGSPDNLTVYLRDPILEWCTADVFNIKFRQLSYDVMSKWLEIEGDNVRLRRTGIYWHANWTTNSPPGVAFERYAFGSVSTDEFRRTLRYVEPLLGRLMSQMASRGELVVEFLDYVMHVYSENGIECKRIEAVWRFLEQEGKHRKEKYTE